MAGTVDYMTLARNEGTKIGTTAAEAPSLGIGAAADLVNESTIFNFGPIILTNPSGSIYDGLFTSGTNTDEYDSSTGTGTNQATPAQNNDMMAQIAKIFESFVTFLTQLINQYNNGTAPADGTTPAGTTPAGGTKPADGTKSADGTTVTYNGKEVSSEKMDEVNDILDKNVNIRKFEQLAKVIDNLVSEKSFITAYDANTLTTTLTGLTNAEYIAFQKYFNEQTGKSLESVIRSLEGKGLDSKQAEKLMQKADDAQAWLTKVDKTEDTEEPEGTEEPKEVGKDTVTYNGKEVSKAKMEEVDALLEKNTIKREFAKLEQELAQLADKGLGTGWWIFGTNDKDAAQNFVNKLNNMESAKYIAFQKYYKEATGNDLEQVLANLEGKNGVSSEMVDSLMQKADDAQDWLTGKTEGAKETGGAKETKSTEETEETEGTEGTEKASTLKDTTNYEDIATSLHAATSGTLGTDNEKLNKIFSQNLTDEEWAHVMKIYKTQHPDSNLIKDIQSEWFVDNKEQKIKTLEDAMMNSLADKYTADDIKNDKNAAKIEELINNKPELIKLLNSLKGDDLLKAVTAYQQRFGGNLLEMLTKMGQTDDHGISLYTRQHIWDEFANTP